MQFQTFPFQAEKADSTTQIAERNLPLGPPRRRQRNQGTSGVVKKSLEGYGITMYHVPRGLKCNLVANATRLKITI